MKTLLTTLHAKFIHNSLALPCIASYCGAACGDIAICEFTTHEPKENILAAILAEQPDVVAFSVYIWNRRESLELIDLLATVRPELKLVIGGPEVSFDGEELFAAHPGLDALVRGEGELPMRELLLRWQAGTSAAGIPRLTWRNGAEVVSEPDGPLLDDLDDIPSPFQNGLVDCSRGFVYFETSRGCPYRCSFCMSALDDSVRSFSLQRIKSDLDWLFARNVAKIKLVDRTFNYDARRAQEIFTYILEHNRGSHLHFEIGAHLLTEENLALLETVPEGMFHFEIGVQSTLTETLTSIDRRVSLEKLLDNVSQLKQRCRIDLHLDLIAGLPGEDYHSFLLSVDRILALDPDHLQIEPVKLLPGAPLRVSAAAQNLRFDPNPPYTVVSSDSLSYADIERLKALSRYLDLTWNSGRLRATISAFAAGVGSMSRALELLALHLHEKGLFRLPLSQESLFAATWKALQAVAAPDALPHLCEQLARDYALCERVIAAKAPPFMPGGLTESEQREARGRVEARQQALRGSGTKLQYYAAPFTTLQPGGERQIHLFFYLSRSGTRRQVEETVFPGEPGIVCN